MRTLGNHWLSIAAAALLLGFTRVASATPLYGLLPTGYLVSIDPDTATTTFLVDLSPGVHQYSPFGLTAWDGRLYTFEQIADEIVEIDPVTLTITNRTTIERDFLGEGAFAVGPDGAMYIAEATGELFRYRLDDGSLELLTDQLPNNIDGLVFDGDQSFFAMLITGTILRVDVETWDFVDMGNPGMAHGTGYGGLTMAPDGSLFAVQSANFYTVSLGDFVATEIGDWDGRSAAGIAYLAEVPELSGAEMVALSLMGIALVRGPCRARPVWRSTRSAVKIRAS